MPDYSHQAHEARANEDRATFTYLSLTLDISGQLLSLLVLRTPFSSISTILGLCMRDSFMKGYFNNKIEIVLFQLRITTE